MHTYMHTSGPARDNVCVCAYHIHPTHFPSMGLLCAVNKPPIAGDDSTVRERTKERQQKSEINHRNKEGKIEEKERK